LHPTDELAKSSFKEMGFIAPSDKPPLKHKAIPNPFKRISDPPRALTPSRILTNNKLPVASCDYRSSNVLARIGTPTATLPPPLIGPNSYLLRQKRVAIRQNPKRKPLRRGASIKGDQSTTRSFHPP
jgi:hypothetical protein